MKLPKKIQSLFSALFLLLIAGYAVWQGGVTIQHVLTHWNKTQIYHDPSTEWGRRLQQIKADLPATGTVGYISDGEISWGTHNSRDTEEEFSLTQYFLVPLILDRGSIEHEYVVGNFGNLEYKDAQFQKKYPIQLVKDYGYGFYLFKGRQP